MKSFLVFVFTTLFVLGWTLDEPSLLPRRRFYKSPKTHLLNYQINDDQKFEKIMYLKHLMEVKCLRKVLNTTRNRNRIKYRKSYRFPKPAGSPLRNFQDNSFYFHTMRPNFISAEPRRRVFFGNNRIIFLPGGRVVGKQTKNFQQNKTPQPKFKPKNENPNVAASSPLLNSATKNVYKEDITVESYPDQKLKNQKSKPLTNPVKNYQSWRLKPIRPFDVTEAINEELVFDLLNQRNGEEYNENPFSGAAFLKKVNEQTIQEIKPLIVDSDESSKTILKTSKGNGNLKKSKKILYSPQFQEYSVTVADFKNYTTDGFSDFVKKTTQSESPTIVKVENFTKAFTKKVTITSTTVEKWSDTSESLQETTATPETMSYSEFYDDGFDLYLLNVSDKKQNFNIPTLFPLNVNQTTIENFTMQDIPVIEKETNLSVTFTEDQTTPTEQTTGEFLSTKFTSWDLTDKTTDNPDTTEGLINSSETVSSFGDGIDRPLTIDLLPEKNQESVWKSGRKMQFGEETLTTAISNEIVGQRRSDILIGDNADYYPLDDSLSSLSYLKKLKQINSLNSSTDFVIQLIPIVIDDLREGKFTPEDILVLSKSFGKYWPAVLALSNNTNIDMLPLLKMKNEEDLNNTLRTFLPDNFLEMATETKETHHDSYLGYDYDEEYEDMGEYQDLVETEESYRYRRGTKKTRNLEYESDTRADISEISADVELTT